MVTPIAQIWKLRPRQVRVGTLDPVPHPRGLPCNVTCGGEGHQRAQMPKMPTWPWPPHLLRDTNTHRHPQSTQVSQSFHPKHHTHTHTPTIAQHSFIPPTRIKGLQGSRPCAGCQSCGEQDRLAHSDRCPTPTTHIAAHTHTAQCAHGLAQTPTQVKQMSPHTRSLEHNRRSFTHLTASHPALTPPPSGTDSRLPTHLRATSKEESHHTQCVCGGVTELVTASRPQLQGTG